MLTALVVGFIFLKNKSSVVEVAQQFQMLPSVTAQNETPFYQEETIDSNETYRMAHVASMTELPGGTLVTTWYAGSGELQPDVKIYCSIKPRGQSLLRGEKVPSNFGKGVSPIIQKGVSPIIHYQGNELVGTAPFSDPFVVMTREEAAKELGW